MFEICFYRIYGQRTGHDLKKIYEKLYLLVCDAVKLDEINKERRKKHEGYSIQPL
jgi:hypothetical protein